MLEARRLGRQDGRTGAWLLQDIDLGLHAGERLALTGPSGAGKSLLLRSLALLDPLSAGEVLWRAGAVEDAGVTAFRSHVVYVQQRPAFFEGTVEANLRLPFTLHAHKTQRFDRAQAVEQLNSLGRSEAFLDKKASELSGGESQITALIRALALAPHVLLLDEATAALDSATAAKLAGLVNTWMEARPNERACIWVGHDQAFIASVTTGRVAIAGGRIQP